MATARLRTAASEPVNTVCQHHALFRDSLMYGKEILCIDPTEICTLNSGRSNVASQPGSSTKSIAAESWRFFTTSVRTSGAGKRVPFAAIHGLIASVTKHHQKMSGRCLRRTGTG
ncbi:MAG TPA: hypothetical protein VER12_17210 [Polyangiaceae bacterium]|nr:hypothetical protein [Polyangiaceae bacterium]